MTTNTADLLFRLGDRTPENWDGPYSLPENWYNLVDKLDRKISEIDPDYKLHQAKAKFGQLRYYIGISEGVSEEDRARINSLIVSAEDASYWID